MDGWLSGIFEQIPYFQVRVDYPADMDADSISTGVKRLDELIRGAEGTIVVLAQSQGAQVASTWLDEFSWDTNVPGPERLQFVLTGNPLRHDTGRLVGGFVVGGGRGKATRTDTRHQVIDVAREHDGWAISKPWRDMRQQWGRIWDHSRYQGVDLATPPLTEETVGNTTLLTYP
jgi:PE-PPE domain